MDNKAMCRKCRDCGEEKEWSDPKRKDICSGCWVVRGRVLEKLKSGGITMSDFKNWQRNGLRTKRLIKMGYGDLVSATTTAQAESPKGRSDG
ncbi:hypothetical protein LCGC14_1471780 [marine sediment metagenome]|uniref:Uncharacterized protein n=1 Tax=marine sediment metagenome TaxID=412755 RepID=A0A0F9MDY2_9ZZZZ